MIREKLSRRSVLRMAALAAAAPLLQACAPAAPTATSVAPTAVPTPVPTGVPTAVPATSVPKATVAPTPVSKAQPYKGEEIALSCTSGGGEANFRALATDFEQATGIKLNVIGTPYADLHNKQFLVLSGKTGEYDVLYSAHHWADEFMGSGYYEPLKKYVDDRSLTEADWDLSDYIPSLLEGAGSYKGTLYALPVSVNVRLQYYRTDMLQAANLKPPVTWDDLLALCKNVTAPDKNAFGAVIPGKQDIQLTCAYLDILQSYGRWMFDSNWKSLVTTPEGLEAGGVLMEMFKYTPSGATGYDGGQAAGAFTSGSLNVATFNYWASGFPAYTKPATSKITDKLGVSVLPKKVKSSSPGGHWIMGVTGDSKKKEVAWAFVKWYTSKAVEQARVFGKIGGNPNRISTMAAMKEKPDFVPFITAFQSALADSIALPRVPEYQALLDSLNLRLSQAVVGNLTVKDALQKHEEDVQAIFKKSGRL